MTYKHGEDHNKSVLPANTGREMLLFSSIQTKNYIHHHPTITYQRLKEKEIHKKPKDMLFFTPPQQ